MSLPETGTVPVIGGNESLPKAFLAKLPPHFWKMFADSTQTKENFKVSLDNGEFKIITPNGETITMSAHTTGVPTEIHGMDPSGAGLQPVALATARLTAPIAGPATKAAPNKPLSSLIAKSSAATSMSRTQSSPAGTGISTTPPVTAGISPKIPLKTRVIQLLAFGNFSEAQIATKLDSPAADVMRVVNVLGRRFGDASPPVYELQPAQYSKVKINDWTYTPIEKRIVIKRARKAFDELDLPAGADERVEMDKKEKEPINARPKSSNSPPDTPAPLPAAKISPYSQSKILPDGTTIADMPSCKRKKAEVEPEPKAVPKSTKPVSNDSKASETAGRAIKKGKAAPKTAFGKELEKHRAGKRGTSMPNGKRESGVASPRPAAKSTLSKSTKTKEKAKLSFDERMKRKANYSDSDSDSESEEDKPSPPKVIKIARGNPRAGPAPVKVPTPVPAPPKELSPRLIALGLALFGPEAEAEDAAHAAAAAAAEAEAAEQAAIKAKAKAEAAAANAAAMAAAAGRRPADDHYRHQYQAPRPAEGHQQYQHQPSRPVEAHQQYQHQQSRPAGDHHQNHHQPSRSAENHPQPQYQPSLPQKTKISPKLAHLGLPARPLEDCQIVDTNPLQAEPIGRPRTGSQPSNSSHGSPYANGHAMAMDRSHSSNGSNPQSRQGSHPLSRSQNSTQTSFEIPAAAGPPRFKGPPPTLSHEDRLREQWEQRMPAYQALVKQISDFAHAAVDVTNRTSATVPDKAEFERLLQRYQRWHTELMDIKAYFGGNSPTSC